MTAKKRTRQAPEVTRAQLLDATEHLMVAEGYAAVTTRRVATEVGLTAALVHYYFPTTGDLLLAAYRRAVERHDYGIRQALASENPLRALWSLLMDSSHIALGVEFAALANHRKEIRNEIAKHDEACRRLQVRALSRMFADSAAEMQPCSPVCAVMLMDGMSRAFTMDKNLGISYAHAEAGKYIEQMLDRMERGRKPETRPRLVAAAGAQRPTVRAAQKARASSRNRAKLR